MKNILKDPELWAIIAFNVVLFYAFIVDITGFDTIVLLFFLQNLFIGLQYFVRLAFEGRRNFPNSWRSALFLAFFFLFGFGLFHLVYSIFMISILSEIPGPIDFGIVRGSFWFMLGNTLFSLISDIKRDSGGGGHGTTLFFFPFIRVLPMHIFIILAFRAAVENSADEMGKALVIFMLLKTFADVLMHIILNQTWQQRRPPVIGQLL